MIRFLLQEDEEHVTTAGSGESDSQAFKRVKLQEIVKSYVNMHSVAADGFTAMHFASFYGNIKLIKLLIKHGANIFAVNKLGINMMHVAAQGDQPLSVAFF